MESPIITFGTPDLLHVDKPILEKGPWACADQEGIPTTHSVIDLIIMRNRGRTPAFPGQLRVGWRVVPSLPPEPVYDRAIPCERGSIIREDNIKDDVPFQMGIRLNVTLTDEQIASSRDETAYFWFYCSLHYRNFLDDKYEARACWRWGRPDTVGIYYWASDGSPPPAYEGHKRAS